VHWIKIFDWKRLFWVNRFWTQLRAKGCVYMSVIEDNEETKAQYKWVSAKKNNSRNLEHPHEILQWHLRCSFQKHWNQYRMGITRIGQFQLQHFFQRKVPSWSLASTEKLNWLHPQPGSILIVYILLIILCR